MKRKDIPRRRCTGRTVAIRLNWLLVAAGCSCLAAPMACAQNKPDPLEQARKDQKKHEAKQPVTTDAIIPDSQFESALPPIDPALGQPLPPIESIDAVPVTPVNPPATLPTASTPPHA